tara:strand:- start:389 stop:1795 length:1407 start_codon:yes stop_codon:yes gene_type:complete
MSTHDYVIANASGSSVRSDLNNALAAIVSNNSSSSEPSTKYAYMLWADTTNGILKIRNSANNAWVELLQLDGTLTMEDGAEALPGLAFRDDLDTGLYSPSANVIAISTGATQRLQLSSGGTVFNEGGADVDFRIEGDSEANLFYVDAGNDRVGIGSSTPARVFDATGSSNLGIALVKNTASSISNAAYTFMVDSSAHTSNMSLAGAMSVDVNGGRAFTINGSGEVGINCSNPHDFYAEKLVIEAGAEEGMTINRGANSGTNYIMFAEGTSGEARYRGWVGYTHNSTAADGVLTLAANGSTRAVLKGNGDLSISDGNLIVATNGHGIDFSASEGGTGTSSEVSLLDDYESGTWTPGLTVGTATHSGNKYIKVGKVVHFWGRLWSPSDVSSSADFTITGLPFAVAISTAAGSAFGKEVNQTGATTVYVTTSEQIQMYGHNSGNAWTRVIYTDLAADSSCEIYYCGSYYTS